MIRKPWLFLPASLAHHLSGPALKLYGRFKPFQTLTWKPQTWRGLEFTNPLGIAGGVDKNGDLVEAWWTVGPGFVEVGTVTPQPQGPNPGKIMDRDIQGKAVWNKMGFPNKGVHFLKAHLQKLPQPSLTPVFANIGKNRETPLEKASDDYVYCIRELTGLCDVFVINISSPNTKGLRELFQKENFQNFFQPIMEAVKVESESKGLPERTPVLLKISPDLQEEDLHFVLDLSLQIGVDGWIVSNSTKDGRKELAFPEEGGVSGQPIAFLSKNTLQKTIDHLGSRREDRLVISCGGVMTPEDVIERLDMGADLVQVYSSLIFSGPFFFRQVSDHVHLQGHT